MKTKEQVTKYFKDYFDRYELNDYDFFVTMEYNSKEYRDELVEISLFPFDEMDEETLSRISVHTGLSIEEILNCDEKAAARYIEKYPFIRLFHAYKGRCRWYSQYKTEFTTVMDLLKNAVFNENPGYPVEIRYDHIDINARLVSKLKEIDAVMPGTYHKDAEITQLMFRTEFFITFPACGAMLQSFIEMVDRLKELFFRALKTNISQDEINEINFLANVLDATDATIPKLITYDNICKYKKAYIEENLTDFFSYVKVRALVDASPWRCKEFFDDMSLVREFINISPQAKGRMREFATEVSKLECDFVWSDARPVVFSPEEENELAGIDFMLGREPIPYEKRAKEHTRIYIEKTSQEMSDWEKYAKRILDASASVAKGGLKLPKREVDLNDQIYNIDRIKRRVAASHGGNKS